MTVRLVVLIMTATFMLRRAAVAWVPMRLSYRPVYATVSTTIRRMNAQSNESTVADRTNEEKSAIQAARDARK